MHTNGYNCTMTKTWSWLKLGLLTDARGNGDVNAPLCVDVHEGEERTALIGSAADECAVHTAAPVTFHAMPSSKLHIVKVSLPGEGMTGDVNITVEENAAVTYSEVMLSKGLGVSKFTVYLNGRGASFASDVAYMGNGSDVIDIDHTVNHNAPATTCRMDVSGSLDGAARKIYRGTIDFHKGCKEAAGHETEEVVMMSNEANSRSLPVILCDEEDVEGDHGASCGRIDEASLFYMQSRGISADEAKKMICTSFVARVIAIIEQYDKAAAKRAEKVLL